MARFTRLCGCYSGLSLQVAGMSLNPSEQMVFDYVQSHPEERQYWIEKVRKTCRQSADDHGAVLVLEPELWRYFEERSAVASPFREVAQRQGVRRTSMKNLAEHWVRLWTPPRAKKSARPPEA